MSRRRKSRSIRPAVPIISDTSTAPAERWNHGSDSEVVDLDRDGAPYDRRSSGPVISAQRVVSPCLHLYNRGRISFETLVAADRWQRAWADGLHGARPPSGERVRVDTSNSGPADGYSLRQLDALAARRAAIAAVGTHAAELLDLVCCECHSITAIADDRRVRSARGMTERVVSAELHTALDALTTHYESVDRSRRDAARARRDAERRSGVVRQAA